MDELDWQGYRDRYDDIQRLDRILEAEGDSPNRYQATKQADVLMLFYLLSTESLRQLFERLGYEFDPDMIPRSVAYYGARTSHGSTLSRVVDAWVLARSDRPQSWSLFQQAIESDVADIQGGTTSEGIHLGAMAGTVDLMQRCYTGLEVRDRRLWLNPQLPEALKSLCIRLRFRGQTLALTIGHQEVQIRAVSAHLGSIRIQVGERSLTLQPGEARVVPIQDIPIAVESP